MAVDPRITRTRERLMRAAYDVLADVGYERATIELVSERSGVARSTLYRHWESRDELFRDAFAQAALGRSPDDDRMPALGVPDEAVESATRDMSAEEMMTRYAVTFAVGLRETWGRMAVTMAAAGLDENAEQSPVRVFTDGTRRDLGLIVEKAKAQGTLADTVDTDAAVSELVDLVVAPMFYRYQFTDHPATTDQARMLAARAWAFLTS